MVRLLRGGQHAARHACADCPAAEHAGAFGDYQRNEPGHECETGHHDSSEAGPRAFNGRIRLSLKDAPGWEAGEAFIERGKTEGEIEIKPDPANTQRSANLRIVGTATVDGVETTRAAGTAAAVQKVYPRKRFVPADLDGLIGVGSVAKD